MADGKEQTSSEQGEGGGGEKKEEGVFGKIIKTVTYSNGYKNDGKDTGFKALNTAAMNSTAAIAGMKTGTKQTKIKGDTVYHYLNNHYVVVDGNDTLYVNKKQSQTVHGDAQFLYSSNYLQAVKGNQNTRVNQNRTLIVLGESEENYVGKHEVTAPEEFEWKSFERGFSFNKLDLMGAGVDIHGVEITAHGADVDVGIENAEGAVFHQEIKLNHDEGKGLITRVGAEADALLRIDVLLDLGLGTPFR